MNWIVSPGEGYGKVQEDEGILLLCGMIYVPAWLGWEALKIMTGCPDVCLVKKLS